MYGSVDIGAVPGRQGWGARAARAGSFVLHLGEMTLAMMVGMAAGAAILALLFTTVLASAIGGLERVEALNQFGVLICLVEAAGMTVTMVVWMRFRGMDRRSTAEMAVAMLVPLIPIFGLLGAGVISGAAACGVYCVAMLPAMVAAMLLRYDLYAGHTSHTSHTGHAGHTAHA